MSVAVWWLPSVVDRWQQWQQASNKTVTGARQKLMLATYIFHHTSVTSNQHKLLCQVLLCIRTQAFMPSDVVQACPVMLLCIRTGCLCQQNICAQKTLMCLMFIRVCFCIYLEKLDDGDCFALKLQAQTSRMTPENMHSKQTTRSSPAEHVARYLWLQVAGGCSIGAKASGHQKISLTGTAMGWSCCMKHDFPFS